MQATHASSPLSLNGARALSALTAHYFAVVMALIAIYAFDAWVATEDVAAGEGSLRSFMLTVALGFAAAAWYWMSSRTEGWLELLVGVVAAAAIGAVVGPRVQENGFAFGDLSGALALAGTVVLIVTGAAKLLRSARSNLRRLWAIPLAWLLLEMVAFPVAIGVYATNAPHPPVTSSSPQDVGLYFEDIVLTTDDGTRLSAWYIEGDNGSGVVMLHGSGSTKSNVLDHAAMLAEQGYSLVLLDARGHGASSGPIMDLGWFGASDIAPAVDYLSGKVEGRIGLFGLSMGGESAITAAADDERVAAVVSDGAGDRTASDRAAHADSVMDRVAVVQAWLTYGVADLLTPASQPIALDDAMRRVGPRPVFLISGQNDMEVEANMTWARAGGDTAEVWVLRDTAHNAGIVTHPEEYESKVIDFLSRSLL